MIYVALFFAGAFLCNAVPHLVAGLQGQPFPTPFARPRGIGNSPPVVNFLWGLFNLLVGGWLWSLYPVRPGLFPTSSRWRWARSPSAFACRSTSARSGGTRTAIWELGLSES